MACAGHRVVAEVIEEYDRTVSAPDGSLWSARACARPFAGHWEGWIEFVPRRIGLSPVRTARETTQPDRHAVAYWAGGITPTYLDGALARALHRPTPRVPDGPHAPGAILDPYAVYIEGGEVLLGAQLNALDVVHLRGIADAYEMAPSGVAAAASPKELRGLILAAVEPATRSAR
jgi:hypothetical protein